MLKSDVKNCEWTSLGRRQQMTDSDQVNNCSFLHDLICIKFDLYSFTKAESPQILKQLSLHYHFHYITTSFTMFFCGLCKDLQQAAKLLILINILKIHSFYFRIHSGRCWLWCLVNKHPWKQTFTETCDLIAWWRQILEF